MVSLPCEWALSMGDKLHVGTRAWMGEHEEVTEHYRHRPCPWARWQWEEVLH